jgi:hypothetical protein
MAAVLGLLPPAVQRSSQADSRETIDLFDDAIRLKFGTIFTPDEIVVKTVAPVFKHLDGSLDITTLTFMEPACGNGNFLAFLYTELMQNASFVARFPDAVARSRHILTKNLWGVEILKDAYRACQDRLALLHGRITKQCGGDVRRELSFILKGLHIYHGNTVRTPDDAFELNESAGEGGLLPTWLRTKKWDVIVGNPPYTHLRNLGNRRYAAHPRQRDMAQVFIRWALDHLANKGIISFNTTDAWLNKKLCDGAKETRELIDRRIKELILLPAYSQGLGGNIQTFVICLGPVGQREYELNAKSVAYTRDRLQNWKFVPNDYTPTYRSVEFGKVAQIQLHATGKSSQGDVFCGQVFVDGDADRLTIVSREHIGSRTPGARFKLTRRTEYELSELTGGWRFITTDSNERTLWLWGFLNTTAGLAALHDNSKRSSTDGNGPDDWILGINKKKMQGMPVPDYDWYAEHQPQETRQFLDWIDTNMQDGEAFLNGIDAAFDAVCG